jgi:hypothetical protein
MINNNKKLNTINTSNTTNNIFSYSSDNNNIINNNVLSLIKIINNNKLNTINSSNMTSNNFSYTTNNNSNALKYSNNALSLSDMTNNRNIKFSEMNIKKKEIIIGEIILEVLKISKLELQDEVKNKISKEMEQIRIRISQEEVIKRISFVFENEIEVMIYQCAKNILLDIHRSLLYNQDSINEIIEETNLNESRNINDTIALSVMTVVREMQEGKWLLKMIEANVKLSDGVNTIKERWGKMIKKKLRIKKIE